MEGQEALAVVQEATVPRGAVDIVDQEAPPRHLLQGPQEPQGLLLQGP